MLSGILYIVPTPIGNLEDITLRGLRILKQVNTILAEDTRHTAILLAHYSISTPMVAYHQHNEHQQTPLLVQRLKSGESMALVSDAGTPGISDAAFLLVRACLSEGIKVKCLPGATALIPALIESGFPTRQFMFAGFLPQKKGRQSKLKELCETQSTLILYESPARLLKLLEEIAKHFGKERKVSVSRELTKMHEETVRGTASELLSHFQQKAVKGELVVVIAPAG